MSKVFLSYSHKDESFVTELFRRLTRDGVDCFFDKESIGWGDNWVLELERGLDECDFIVPILTPEFCGSEWAKLERTAIQADDPAGMKKKIRPLLLKECKDELPRFLKFIQYIDVSTDDTFEKNYPSICQNLGCAPEKEEEKEEVNRTQLPPLCRLPLALELVKHFLNLRPELSIRDLLEEMNALGQMETLDIFTGRYGNQLPTGHEKQVAATFRMGWDESSAFERKVLSAMSQLAPAPVPRRVLRKILETDSESKLRDPLDEAVSRLNTGLSLVELDGESDPRMHRLISAFVRTVTDEGELLNKNLITAIGDEMARVEDDEDTQSFRQLEKVLPHADFLLTSAAMEPGQAVDIADYMGWHHKKWGRYRLGEGYRRKALRLAEANYKPGASEIAAQQSNLAVVLKDLGELEEARDLLRAALQTAQKTFDPEHPYIAGSQSNLAMVLADLGEIKEAKELATRSYQVLLKNYGPDFPRTKIAKGNLDEVSKRME